jgi:VanZ family protein
VVVVVSLVVLFAPASDVPSGVPISDKVIHAGLFLLLAATGRWARLPVAGLALGLAAYAGVSEALQSTLPINRDGDWRDASADLLGIVLGLALARVLTRRGARPVERSRAGGSVRSAP